MTKEREKEISDDEDEEEKKDEDEKETEVQRCEPVIRQLKCNASFHFFFSFCAEKGI